MLDQITAIYQDVANELVRALPAGWTKAWVQIEMEDDNGSIACFCTTSASAKAVHVKLPLHVYDLFARMQRIARDNDPQGAWTTATFMLASDGSFNVDYGYEPVPIEDQFSRRIAWKKRYGLA